MNEITQVSIWIIIFFNFFFQKNFFANFDKFLFTQLQMLSDTYIKHDKKSLDWSCI